MQTIQLKRGTLADLIALNPTPAQGEIIIDTDAGNFKIGDGARSWSELPYANISFSSLRAGQISDFNTAVATVVSTVIPTIMLGALFDVNNATPNNGDLLVSVLGDWTPTAPSAIAPALWVAAPTSSTAAGTSGQIARDSNYFYLCVANSTWVRAALETW
jgi:hypothetical protein